ncbi:hypothetical protein FB192DRAFT_1325630 [Mucor lusitanicus]|uniref:SMAD/FHA domain-containing protein n=1 Tax=Mucor circinelloides f. lusitanicus TaxID=29924 RepID=A0A8H4BIG6_MUCCL|nr:hypothetical protein FB192DRAFT_1325630 [Mucor lusitanicus]
MAPSTSTAAATTTSSGAPVEGVRRRSLSGASALLARRFTRNTASASPSSATIASSASSTLDQNTVDKVHVRIVPNIDNPSRSLIFDIVDRQLQRHANLNCMSFKSKVVSRCHCEVWVETDGKLYIRDTKSSSGTFLNHVRLSPAGSESRPVELHDGDIVQLGVDFQGGREEMYRSVKMRFELNRSSRQRPLSFNLNAFQNLHMQTSNDTAITTTTTSHCHDDVDECCICLYALAPFQALFVSPCSHTYHFKCIRPLLQSYPGFQCPICRTYSDLEASVATDEADEVVDGSSSNSSSSNNKHHERSNTQAVEEEEGVLSNTEDEEDDIEVEDVDMSNLSSVEPTPTQVQSRTTSTSTPAALPKRERRSSHIMDKLKMVFFEKRKSASTTQQHSKQSRQSHKKRARPLSYPNLLSVAADEQPPSLPPHAESSSQPLNLSRHITTPERSTTTTTTSTRPLRMEIDT